MAARERESENDQAAIRFLEAVLLAAGSSDFFQVDCTGFNSKVGHVVGSPSLPAPVSTLLGLERRGWISRGERGTGANGVDWRLYRVTEWGLAELEKLHARRA